MNTVTLGHSASVNQSTWHRPAPLSRALRHSACPSPVPSFLPVGDLGSAVCNPTTCLSALAVFGILFPTYNTSLLWLGVYPREPELRAFVPLCKSEMIHVPKYKNALQFRSAGH